MLFNRVQGAIVIACLALSLAGVDVSAQSQTSKYQTWENPDQTASPASDDPRVQALLDELAALVDEADRARAADPRFLEDLRELIRGYDWPWRLEILDEDFSDGAQGQRVAGISLCSQTECLDGRLPITGFSIRLGQVKESIKMVGVRL